MLGFGAQNAFFERGRIVYGYGLQGSFAKVAIIEVAVMPKTPKATPKAMYRD
jgi:hypothetical protein